MSLCFSYFNKKTFKINLIEVKHTFREVMHPISVSNTQRLGLDIVTLLGTSGLMWHTQTEKGIFLTSLKKTLMQVLRSPTYINLKIF